MQKKRNTPFPCNAMPFLKHRLCKKTGLTILAAAGMCSTASVAQTPTQRSQIYNSFDLKHYATSQLPAQGYAMAGTAFDFNGTVGDHALHLMLFDNNDNTTLSMMYDNTDFDERTVGVHYINPNDIVLVSTHAIVNNATGSSGIQIMRLDASGNPVLVRNIDEQNNSLDYWPMGSTVNNNILYVCGYTTNALSAGAAPRFTDAKSAFVLNYDLNSNTLINMRTYDWPNAGVGTPDYDIAHRVKVLSSGNIWIGGMCNGTNNVSAMMNMQLDATSLAILQDKPIDMPSNWIGINRFNSSFDFWEDQRSRVHGYVLGNYCYDAGAVPGMDLHPMFFNATSVDLNTLANTGGSINHTWASQVDYTWGNVAMKGNNNASIILSGFQSDFVALTTPQVYPTTHDNINPFLADIELEVNPTTNNLFIGANWWRTIESANGTGGQFINANSYPNLGGTISNMLWGTPNAVRNGAGTDIILNAPLWNPNTSRLNLKYIRTDQVGTTQCGSERFEEAFTATKVDNSANRATSVKADWKDYNGSPNVYVQNADAILDCSSGFFSKQTELRKNTAAITVSVSPNPAQSIIELHFAGTVNNTDNLRVTISDMLGRVSTVLYTGPKSGLQDKLALPQLAKGLYVIGVQHNGVQLKAVPLTIN